MREMQSEQLALQGRIGVAMEQTDDMAAGETCSQPDQGEKQPPGGLWLEKGQYRSEYLSVHGKDAYEQTNIANLLQFLVSIVVVKDDDARYGASERRGIGCGRG